MTEEAVTESGPYAMIDTPTPGPARTVHHPPPRRGGIHWAVAVTLALFTAAGGLVMGAGVVLAARSAAKTLVVVATARWTGIEFRQGAALALTLVPTPSTAVLVAVATSFGVPFAISTPPNAMAYGEGGVTGRDLFVLGLPIMLVGCVLVTLTGGLVLGLFGLP